jgi:prepilin-type N-terminal cleavage/methylation domain-containing protein
LAPNWDPTPALELKPVRGLEPVSGAVWRLGWWKSLGCSGLFHKVISWVYRHAYFGTVRSMRLLFAYTPPFEDKCIQGQCKQSVFHRDTKASAHLIASSFPELKSLDRSLKPVRGLKYPSSSRNGFTLIEIVVTLCIVAILTAIAVPGFRKATEDFRLNEFAYNFESLIKACRNYYLIFNEWPGDDSRNVVPVGNIHHFLPNHLYKGDQFIYTPLRKNDTSFDFQNWIGSSCSRKTVGLTAHLGSYFEIGWEKLQLLGDHKNHFYNVTATNLTKNADVHYEFPEAPKTNNENRYY